MDDAITSIYELLDAIEAVIKAADPAKREALTRTIDAYAEDFPEDFFGPPAHKRRCSCTTYSTQSTRRVVRRHNRSRAPPSGWLIASRKATPNPQGPLIWEMSAEL